MAEKKEERRKFLKTSGRLAAAAGLLGVCAMAVKGRATESSEDSLTGGDEYVWQLDPYKCTQCGLCATKCILAESAVKCVHTYAMCGYCDLCFGYFQPGAADLTEAAENQLCPTGAIVRTFIEDPYYEYDIVEPLCVGCGKCVKGCSMFGNGSLFLQVRHDRCVNCNECAIARACPADAFKRVPANDPYIIKGEEAEE